MARIWIICAIFLSVCILRGTAGDMTFQQMCEQHKEKGRCDIEGIKKKCAQVCGGGGGGGNSPISAPAPAAQPASNEKPTTKRTTKAAAKPQNQNSGKKCDKHSPCVSMDQANAAFLQRCQATNGALKESCYPHCRYDEDTNTMKHAFLGGPCPLAQLRTYLTCASNSKDNTQCCQDTGVLSQKKTGVCGCFCNPTGPVWPGKGEAAKYGPCVGVLTGIMQCHYYAEGAD